MSSGPTLILAATVAELGPVVRRLRLCPDRPGDRRAWRGAFGQRSVIASTTGVGPARATEAAAFWLDQVRPGRVLITGTAGATNPVLAAGHVLVPALVVDSAARRYQPTVPADSAGTLLSVAAIVSSPTDKARLFAEQSVDAVDMETAAIAAACDRRSVPWLCVRAILDSSQRTLPPDLQSLTGENGGVKFVAAAAYVLRRPWRIAMLIGLARGTQRAMSAAATQILTLL